MDDAKQRKDSPILSNRGSDNNHSSSWSVGLDYLSASLFVRWHPEKHVDLIHALHDAKKEAGVENESQFITINGIELEVMAAGLRTGGQYWAVNFRAYGLFMQMTTQVVAGEHRANFRVEAKGEVFSQFEGGAVWRGVEKVIRQLAGGVIERAVIGRLDIAADLPGLSPEVFRKAFYEERFTCRAKNRDMHFNGSKLTGVQWGRSPILCRIYDKAEEMMAHPNESKQAALEKRWGGSFDKVLRIEFQLRRDALRSFQVTSWEDWKAKAAAVVKYLTEKWLVLYDDDIKFDSRNAHRAIRHNVWQECMRALEHHYGETEPEEVYRVTRGGSALDTRRAAAMIRGWCAHLAASLGTYHVGEAIRELQHVLNDEINRMGTGWWCKKIARLMALDRMKTAAEFEEIALKGLPYING